MSANRTETRKIELVEIDNICRSFHRINCATYGSLILRRALFHALMMESNLSSAMMTKLREALELP